MTTMATRKLIMVLFKVGDTVKLKAHHLKFLQLLDRYIGPLQITEALSPYVALRVKLPTSVTIHDVVCASMLEKWYEGPEALAANPT